MVNKICLDPFLIPILLSGSDGKESACSAVDSGDTDSIPRSGRSPGEGSGYPLQYLSWKIAWTEKPDGLQSMGSQSQTRLSD